MEQTDPIYVQTESISVQSEVITDKVSQPIPFSIYENEEDKSPISMVISKKRNYTENTEQIKIKPELILGLIQTDDFITKINRNLKILCEEKKKKYKAIGNELEIKIAEDRRALNMYKLFLDTKHPEENFPFLQTNTLVLEKVKTLISTASCNILNLSENDHSAILRTRHNLIQAITDPDKGIMSILGNTREKIRETLLKQIFILSRTSKLFIGNFLNIILTGGSGFGKTKIANVISFVSSKIGILLTDKIYSMSPKDLVSKWVGDSALKTTSTLLTALESVVFIDECYQIAEPNTNNSHGRECLTELVNFMDKYIGLSVIICAGYKDKVEQNFIKGNDGIERRFPMRYDLPKYSSIDLTNIFFKNVIHDLEIDFNSDLKKYIYTLISNIDRFNVFENQSGDILNLTQIFFQTYYSIVLDDNASSVELFDVIETSFDTFINSKGLKMNITYTEDLNISQTVQVDF
jgi:hypothetical protein